MNRANIAQRRDNQLPANHGFDVLLCMLSPKARVRAPAHKNKAEDCRVDRSAVGVRANTQEVPDTRERDAVRKKKTPCAHGVKVLGMALHVPEHLENTARIGAVSISQYEIYPTFNLVNNQFSHLVDEAQLYSDRSDSNADQMRLFFDM
jgi:hypothetical protein